MRPVILSDLTTTLLNGLQDIKNGADLAHRLHVQNQKAFSFRGASPILPL